MSTRPLLVFKTANEDWEYEQIHRLNYRTFVEEIPQHKASPSHRLVDKFHAENTYLICLSGTTLAGMLAVRGARPFSLDQKLPALDSYLPSARSICEIRLLAIDKKFRGAQVLQGILALLWQHGIDQGYDLAIISGTTRQFKLYHHLGFVPFGPLVGTGDAQFQPMYITLETFEKTAREFLRSSPSRSFHAAAVNFLPGPVAIKREVQRAFEQLPESHRSEGFIREFEQTKARLCELTGARNVELFSGSGTLANDVVAAQISLLQQPGIVLSNGEFGERLIDHAERWKLSFQAVREPWGQPFDWKSISEKIRGLDRPAWVWAVNCETSSGILNDLESLKALCSEHHLRLFVDCISSMGTVPVNLQGVDFASCASGKGLRSYPGLSMVFYDEVIVAPESVRLPRYLDLSYYAANGGLPFTFSSNLLHALHAAVKPANWEERFAELRATNRWLRARLRELGFTLVGGDDYCSPAVTTISLPPELESKTIGGLIQECGYQLSCNSDYLKKRNWIQVCTMGESSREKLLALTNALHRVCFSRHPITPKPVQGALVQP